MESSFQCHRSTDTFSSADGSSSGFLSGSGGVVAPRKSRAPSSEKLRLALSLTTKSFRKPGEEFETISVASGGGVDEWLCVPSLTVGFLPPLFATLAPLPRSHKYTLNFGCFDVWSSRSLMKASSLCSSSHV